MSELTNTFGNGLPKVLDSSKPSSTIMMLKQLKSSNTNEVVVNENLEMERKSIFESKPKLDRASPSLRLAL